MRTHRSCRIAILVSGSLLYVVGSLLYGKLSALSARAGACTCSRGEMLVEKNIVLMFHDSANGTEEEAQWL
jgi:hypothetical protein